MLANVINAYLARFEAASTAGRYTETITLLDEMRAAFRNSPPSSEEISSCFEDIIKNPRTPGASLIFVAAWFNLSQDYAPLLCRVLSDGRLAAWHEQAIELLGKLANPEAIDALAQSLEYRWDFDEWLNIPRKALRSLVAIGTDNALAVVSQARQSDVPEIREEATELLEVL